MAYYKRKFDLFDSGRNNVREWFVLRTDFGQEHRASRELAKQDFKTFLPIARQEYRDRSGLLKAKRAPLFRMYLFIMMDWQRRSSVLATRGVKGFVGYFDTSQKAPVVRKEIIKELQSRLECIAGRDVVNLCRPRDIEPGQLVHILFGPYRDQTAIVSAVGSRIEVLLRFAGAELPVKLDRDILLPAAA